jgi:hypothetical protein
MESNKNNKAVEAVFGKENSEALEALEAPEAPKPVDTYMEQQTQLLDMIAGGIAGLSKLSAERNFPIEKIARIVEEKLDERDFIEAGDLLTELESNDVLFRSELEEQLSDHNVVTNDTLAEDIESNTDIVELVIDQLDVELKRK